MEIGVTLGIIGIIAAVAVPRFVDAKRMGEARAVARGVNADLALARSLSTTAARVDVLVKNGRTIRGGTRAMGNPRHELRARESGIHVLSQTRYAVFVDTDNIPDNGNELVYKTVDLTSRNQNTTVQIGPESVGRQIRFNSTGTRLDTQRSAALVDNLVVREGVSGQQLTVRVTSGGHSTIH